MSSYAEFLSRKAQWNEGNGFEPTVMPDYLMPFQSLAMESIARSLNAGADDEDLLSFIDTEDEDAQLDADPTPV